MRIALIADIHGNLAAFDAVLAEIAREQPDQVVCLGDVAATGPQPHEVLVRLREIGCPVVMGNADAELVTPGQLDTSLDDHLGKILDISRWGAEQLDAADRAFIATFQPTVTIDLGVVGRLFCCHGSPRSYDDVIASTTPDEALDPMMANTEAEIQAGGHTHVRMLRAWRGREIVNPGSVGLAYQFFADGSVRVPPWAEFATLTVLDDRGPDIEFHRIPYDRTSTLRAMTERGMPHAAWWSEGWS